MEIKITQTMHRRIYCIH